MSWVLEEFIWELDDVVYRQKKEQRTTKKNSLKLKKRQNLIKTKSKKTLTEFARKKELLNRNEQSSWKS